MLFCAKFVNNQTIQQFKVHVAVKEIINLTDEMDSIITQKYKNNHKMPEKKRKDLTGMQKNLGIKKRQRADTLNNKVSELKGYVDKFMNKNKRKEYMMNNKNTPRVVLCQILK